MDDLNRNDMWRYGPHNLYYMRYCIPSAFDIERFNDIIVFSLWGLLKWPLAIEIPKGNRTHGMDQN